MSRPGKVFGGLFTTRRCIVRREELVSRWRSGGAMTWSSWLPRVRISVLTRISIDADTAQSSNDID